MLAGKEPNVIAGMPPTRDMDLGGWGVVSVEIPPPQAELPQTGTSHRSCWRFAVLAALSSQQPLFERPSGKRLDMSA